MGRTGRVIRGTGGAIAAAATILGALKDNPQVGESLGKALERVRSLGSSSTPRARFAGKISAIEACADAVDEAFPDNSETREWRRRAKTLRVRGELLWQGSSGRQRRSVRKQLDEDTAALLAAVNERLVGLTNGVEPSEELPRPTPAG